MKNVNKLLAATFLAAAGIGANAQAPYSCPTCPELSERNPVDVTSLVDATGRLLDDHTILTCDNLYTLDTRMYVEAGQTLTILPGTVVKAEYVADPTATNALVVTRGGKIYAEGSECCPIIFTSDEDPLDGTYSVTNKEKWGGIIILGRAQNTVAAGELNPENPGYVTGGTTTGLGWMEGLVANDPTSRHNYGVEAGQAFVNDDNSGILKYVSIRHGGSELGPNNEINALTLGSVGSGTQISFIEVVSNGDDAIECFGGTVDLKYIKMMFVEDDGLDWDQGYTGRVQYLASVQLPSTSINGTTTVAYGDNGFECDGDDGTAYPRPYLSHPIVSNATILGNDGETSGDNALELKERTEGQIYNSIFANFNKGINIVNPSPSVNTALIVENNTFVSVNTPHTVPTGYTVDASNKFVDLINGFDPVFGMETNGGVDAVLNPYDILPADGSPEVGSTKNVAAIDDWFDAVSYRGAFNPAKGLWWNMESCAITGSVPRVDFMSNASVSCPTDIDGNGKTGTPDLNAILLQFGFDCFQ